MSSPSAWFYWALLLTSFASLTAIFAKISIKGFDSNVATLIRSGIIIVVLVAFVDVTIVVPRPLGESAASSPDNAGEITRAGSTGA